MSLELLIRASGETLYMVFASGFIAVCLGLPLGILLFVSSPGQFCAHKRLYGLLSASINASRSLPFIILLVALIPLTRWLVGSSIGTHAAMVPLSLAASPFLAKLVEGALASLPAGLIEAAQAMGASPRQIIFKILLPEALAPLIKAVTVTLVNLVGYSAMAGTVGGGGLGDLAIRFGYQRFDGETMLVTVAILIAMVQGMQWLGDLIAKRF